MSLPRRSAAFSLFLCLVAALGTGSAAAATPGEVARFKVEGICSESTFAPARP
jgi:hypothetical protein